MNENEKIDYDISSLYFSKTGKGPNVILLHGFGEDHSIWKFQVESLSKDFTVYTPDLPGSGASAIIEKQNLRITDLAVIIKNWVWHHNIRQPVILGHSMGGYVALAYAQLFPDDIKAVGLIHSTAFADSMERKEMRKKSMAFIQDHGTAAFLKTSIPGLFADINHPLVSLCIEKGSSIQAGMLMQYQEAMMQRADSSVLLSSLKVPMLIIAGLYDQAVSYADSLSQSYLSKQTHFYTLRQSAHMGMVEEPGRVNKILQQFLKGL